MAEGDREVVDTADGLVFIVEDRVAFEIKSFGRLEFPADVAETVGRALLRGAKMLREQGPAASGKIIV